MIPCDGRNREGMREGMPDFVQEGKMLNFASDYTEGCHPELLRRLCESNMEQLGGYGTDHYTASAAENIRQEVGRPEAAVYFLTGGTQTNQVVIDSMTESYEGVISAATGHIAVHEAGAIEYSGHKVLTLPGREGKLSAAEVRRFIDAFYADGNYEHMVFPGMVYISQPTEYGTLYSRQELTALSAVCREKHVPLFLDGARLGYALESRETDVALRDIAALCDVFYIGGTKVGALSGEAVVFPKGNVPRHFLTLVKQHGALLAKGRLHGVQFDALFTDGLYFRIARNAIERAEELKAVLRELGFRFYLDSPTNQQFVIFPNEKLGRLGEQVLYGYMEAYDAEHTVIRFCTSWATTEEQIAALRRVLESL